MAEPVPRRRVRRRRWWRRSALPRSRARLALGALVAVVLLILLLLGLVRTEPSQDVPPFDPSATTITIPIIPTGPGPVTTIAAPAPARGAIPTTSRPRS